MLTQRLFFILSLLLIGGFFQSSPAQETKTRYTLTECVQTGLANNSDLQRSRNEIDRATTFKTAAFGDFLPNLTLRGSWSRSDRPGYSFQSTGATQSQDNFSYSASSNLTLFDGLANIYTADRSILNLQAAERSTEKREQDIVFSIQQAFFNALRLQQLVTVDESNLDRSRKQLDRIKEFNAVGSVPMADVYRQQVQVGRDELTLLQAENEYTNALLQLQVLLALDTRKPFEIDPSGEPTRLDSSEISRYRRELPPLDGLINEAIASRADVKQAELNIQSANKNKWIATTGHLPVLSAFAGYNWSNDKLAQLWTRDQGIFSYGLNISLPIFMNFQVMTAEQRAEIDRLNSETVLTDLQRAIAADLKKADNTMIAAEKNVEIARRIVFSAQEDQRIANERYSLGAGTLLDLIIANTNLTSAQSEVVNSTFNYLIARKQLEYALGKMSY